MLGFRSSNSLQQLLKIPTTNGIGAVQYDKRLCGSTGIKICCQEKGYNKATEA